MVAGGRGALGLSAGRGEMMRSCSVPPMFDGVVFALAVGSKIFPINGTSSAFDSGHAHGKVSVEVRGGQSLPGWSPMEGLAQC